VPSHILSALQGVNRELLEALRHGILAGSERVPLPREVARRVARMSDAQLVQCSKGGVLLVDLHFLQKAPAQEVDALAGCEYEIDWTMPMESWLSPVQFVSLAHATLMTAWHVCQWDVEFATVLLGIDRPFAVGVARTEPIEMSIMARKFGHLMLPRWHDREPIWHDLLSLGLEAGGSNSINMAVRGLQLSASARRGPLTPKADGSVPAARLIGRKLRSNSSLSSTRS
jgi:hypothetical protein